MYNGAITLYLSTSVSTFDSADDIGLMVVTRLFDEVQLYTNEAVYDVKSWVDNAGLSFAEHKTEVVLTTKRKKVCL